MMDIKKILKSPIVGQVRSNPKYLWIIVACIPLLFQSPSASIHIWALGLVLGGWIANIHPIRWIALAWIISVIFPSMPFLLLACCGALLKNWRDCLYAGLLGVALTMIYIPGELKNIGFIFIVVGLSSIIYKRVK